VTKLRRSISHPLKLKKFADPRGRTVI
jgi:hypothetical protein